MIASCTVHSEEAHANSQPPIASTAPGEQSTGAGRGGAVEACQRQRRLAHRGALLRQAGLWLAGNVHALLELHATDRSAAGRCRSVRFSGAASGGLEAAAAGMAARWRGLQRRVQWKQCRPGTETAACPASDISMTHLQVNACGRDVGEGIQAHHALDRLPWVVGGPLKSDQHAALVGGEAGSHGRVRGADCSTESIHCSAAAGRQQRRRQGAGYPADNIKDGPR
jgi:hypothetical protein